MRIVRRYPKCGSTVLEAAITFPVVLIVLVAFLCQFLVLQSHIMMQHAVDQVTSEMACFVPVAGVGTQNLTRMLATVTSSEVTPDKIDSSSAKHLEKLSSVAGKVVGTLDAFGIGCEDVLLTLLTGDFIADRVGQMYESLSNQRPILRQMITDVDCTVSYCETTRVFWLDVYYTMSHLFGQQVYQLSSCVNIFGHYQFVWDENDPHADDKIWSLHNFDRGRRFRDIYGGNLPFNYPVIARWDYPTATMIKSIDLTAPGYQQTGAVESKVMHDVRRLSGFDGTDKPWGQDEIHIRGEDIVNRQLIVVIPQNATQPAKEELLNCVSAARSYGVDIQIETYANSRRYEKSANEDDAA